jgi:UDP-glucose 4-epimerase
MMPISTEFIDYFRQADRMARRYLVTGGAGFVGSHLVAALLARGDQCVVLDNLRTGHEAAVLPGARLVRADLADAAAVEEVVADGPWDAVFHFASLSLVGDSMREPMTYLMDNVGNGLRLIDACLRHGVPRFVLSSTAALFGLPDSIPIDEGARVDPGSPYGESKWMLERALLWADRIQGMRSAVLRYFNAAGEDHRPESHLIPLVIDAALGRRPDIAVFGTDYDTPDGTCIRDYVHVSDLAEAHLRALQQLDGRSVTYNLGSSRGHSVLDVIRSVERVSGLRVPIRHAPRRPGDPPILVATSSRIMEETGWQPRFQELDAIVGTAFNWRQAHPQGYGTMVPADAEPG